MSVAMGDSLSFSFSPKASLVWKVNDFFHFSGERRSSCFSFQGVECRMILELNLSKNPDEDNFTIRIEVKGGQSGAWSEIVIRSFIKDQSGKEYFPYMKFLEHNAFKSHVVVWRAKRKPLANCEALINPPNESLTFFCEFKPLIEYSIIKIGPRKVAEEKYLCDECGRRTSEGVSNNEISSQPLTSEDRRYTSEGVGNEETSSQLLTSEDMTTNKTQKRVSKANLSRIRDGDSELKMKINESLCAEGSNSGIKSLIHFKRLSLDLRALLDSEKGADIVLKCTHRKFPVHFSILRSRCKTFAEKCLKESCEGIIEVTDADSIVLEKFLECVYTGNVTNLTGKIAVELYKFGHKYKFEPVVLSCVEFLVDNLSEENLNSTFTLATLNGDTTILKNIVHFIMDNGKYSKDPTWFKSTFDTPDVLLDVYRAIDIYGQSY